MHRPGTISGLQRAVLAAWLAAAGHAAGAGAAAAEGEAAGVRIPAPFAAKTAKDLSGIACRPPSAAGGIPCLVVNDESSFAQMATLQDGRLVAGDAIPLVGSKPPEPGRAAGGIGAIGSCPKGLDDFAEFDGEGVAWRASEAGGGSYFVAGSHACGRNSAKLRASTHLLARIDVDASGAHVPAVLSWRLGPSLAAAARVGAHYNKPLTRQDQGLDVEGVAAAGEWLFFGLRAPSLPGCALTGEPGCGFVVGASAAALFDTAAPPDRPAPTRVARLALGRRVGIRDMAALPDGRLLLLTGPAQDQDGVPSGVAVTTPGDAEEWPVDWVLRDLRPLAGDGKAKAEGLAVLGVSGDTARVLVLFEDPANGGAQEHGLRLPPR